MATSALPSEQEPVVDRFRRWNPVWYRWIKPLLEQVRTNTDDINTANVSISTINTVVDGIEARWGIAVNVDNKVVGLVRLDGGVTGSSFTVLADKFIVRHPTTTTDIQAFVVGLVNGVSTVGINGNLLVDGSILARSISVSTLSAITANVGTLTAGVIQSANGKVTFDLNNGYFRITT